MPRGWPLDADCPVRWLLLGRWSISRCRLSLVDFGVDSLASSAINDGRQRQIAGDRRRIGGPRRIGGAQAPGGPRGSRAGVVRSAPPAARARGPRSESDRLRDRTARDAVRYTVIAKPTGSECKSGIPRSERCMQDRAPFALRAWVSGSCAHGSKKGLGSQLPASREWRFAHALRGVR